MSGLATNATLLKSDEPIYYRQRAEAFRRKGLLELAEADERTANELEVNTK